MYRYLLTLISILFLGSVSAQTKFEIDAPGIVSVGERFNVRLVLNAEPDGDLTPPKFEGFDLLAGPILSQGQSISIINGKTTQESSFTYTYTLAATTEGRFTISAASITSAGKRYSTRSLPIEVVKDASRAIVSSGPQGQGKAEAPAGSVAADDILIRLVPSATTVYRGEAIRVSVKMYTRVGIAGLENAKYPAFNGFWTQELNVDGYDWVRETYNNKVYNSRILREYLLFPQKAGQLEIEQLSMTVIAQLVSNQGGGGSLFDDFFGGGPSVRNVNKNVASAPIRITVKDTPQPAPASFGGAVGNFTFQGAISSASLPANSAGSITLKLSGSGDFPMIDAPKLTLPAAFEQYDVKTTDNVKYTVAGASGTREYEIPFIARAEGDYTIPAIEFTYFDPAAAKYQTLSTGDFNITITKDEGGRTSAGAIVSGISKEDLKILGEDIRFIRVGSPALRDKDSYFVWSVWFFVLTFAIIAIFATLLQVMQKVIKQRSDMARMTTKKANSKALKRLRKAKSYMTLGNKAAFYDETLKALWGYMSDKLLIPVSGLSKESIRTELLSRSIDESDVEALLSLIEECEQAQYSPAATTSMDGVYNNTLDMIGKFESKVKR